MTHDNPAERARRSPEDASKDDIEAALRGRQLFQGSIGQKIDGCRRCREKNRKRRMAGTEIVDDRLYDGDEVVIHAVHRLSDHSGPHWFITSAACSDHPQVPFAAAIQQGTHLIRATARVHGEGNRKHLIDINVTAHSPASDGPAESTIGERQQEYVDDSDDHPDDTVVLDLDGDDPPAHWPAEDRDWLEKLVESNGPLEMPTYDIAKGDLPDADHGGNV